MEFKAGQRVKVEIEYEGEIMYARGRMVNIQREGGHISAVDTSKPEVKITPLGPVNWPPQVGDIWEAEGREWYARKHSSRPFTILVADKGIYPSMTEAELKALNPVLVRRRGQ